MSQADDELRDIEYSIKGIIDVAVRPYGSLVSLSWRIMNSQVGFSDSGVLFGNLNKDKLLDGSNLSCRKHPGYKDVTTTELISAMQLKNYSSAV